MRSWTWWSKSVNQAAILFAVIGGFLVADALWHLRFLSLGYPHPQPVMGVLALVAAFGLFRGREWARWFIYLVIACGTFLVGLTIYREGLTRWSTAQLVLGIYTLWGFRRLSITGLQQMWDICQTPEFKEKLAKRYREAESQLALWGPSDVRLFFISEPLLDLDMLAQAASRAFGHEFEQRNESMADPTDAAFVGLSNKQPTVAGNGSPWICLEPPYVISIQKFDGVEREGLIEDEESADIRSAMMLSRWTLEFELLPAISEAPVPEEGYRWTARLAAELVADGCMAIILPTAGIVRLPTADAIEALRSDSPRWNL